MRTVKKIMVLLLACLLAFGALTACKSAEEQEDEGRKEQARVRLTFLTPLNAINEDTMQQTVYAFNAAYEGKIHVTLVDDVGDTALTQLGAQNEAPDIVSLGEKQFKTAVDSKYLAALDEYAESSESVDLNDIWASSVDRFRYDSESGKTGEGSPLYALPAENNPVVVYYNVDWFEREGINIISIVEDKLPAGYLPHGYYEYTDANKPAGAEWKKTGNVYRVFNNQIPMNWDEVMQLGKIFSDISDNNPNNKYGFMSEWWFSWGWSVGGDCIQLGFTDGVNSQTAAYRRINTGFRSTTRAKISL